MKEEILNGYKIKKIDNGWGEYMNVINKLTSLNYVNCLLSSGKSFYSNSLLESPNAAVFYLLLVHY